MRHSSTIRALIALFVAAGPARAQNVVQFIFTSDQHYGITRATFRGDSNVNASVVNRALVRQLNALPALTLPKDSGVHSGQRVGPIDLVIVGGDVANRAEKGVQPASASRAEFDRDYVRGLALRARDGKTARLFVVPGNHDLSNVKAGGETLDGLDVNVSRAIGGMHFAFLSLWPDSAERIWLAHDLDTVAATTPVILVAHDPPIADPKHFTGADETFEGLLREGYKDGPQPIKGSTDIEQRGLAAFVKAHHNITAYFHGHNNANEFYVWHGPDNDVALNTFRVDSPMKGAISAQDERRLSFQLVTIDPRTMRMTVRECLWNVTRNGPVVFGESRSVMLR